MIFLNLLLILQSVAFGLCFDEYETFLKKLTVGLELMNRQSDFEEKQIKFNSSEKGEKCVIKFSYV